MLRIRATHIPKVWRKDTTRGGGDYSDGEPETVVIIQIMQFPETAASIIFVDSSGNIKEDTIYSFSNIEGVWQK